MSRSEVIFFASSCAAAAALDTQQLWRSRWTGIHIICALLLVALLTGAKTIADRLKVWRFSKPSLLAIGILVFAADIAAAEYELSNFEVTPPQDSLDSMLMLAQHRFHERNGRFASSATELGVSVQTNALIHQEEFLVDSAGGIVLGNAAMKIGSDILTTESRSEFRFQDEWCTGARGYCVLLISHVFNAIWRFDQLGSERIAIPAAWAPWAFQLCAAIVVGVSRLRRTETGGGRA